MKYKVMTVQHKGLEMYAVKAGKDKYFTSTLTASKLEAEQRAIIMTMQWHQDQMYKAWDALKEAAITDAHEENVRLYGDEGFSSMADLLC